jgi:hypothetical protein
VVAVSSAYEAVLGQLTKAEVADAVRAVEGILRTYVYQGTLKSTLAEGTELKDATGKVIGVVAAGEGRETRKKIFNECWKVAAEKLTTAEANTSPTYYYFRASCIAYEAEVSNVFQRLALIPLLENTLRDGLANPSNVNYEGGGLLRVRAAVKGNPEAKGLPGGLYNPDEALKLIDQAIDTAAAPGNAEGILFCENFRRKIITLKELKKTSEAKSLAEQTLVDFPSYLQEGLIPEFIRAETNDCLKNVTDLNASLTN